MSDVLPARSPARCCSTALFRNSAAIVNSLITPCFSNFAHPFSSRPALRSSIAALSAGTFCLWVWSIACVPAGPDKIQQLFLLEFRLIGSDVCSIQLYEPIAFHVPLYFIDGQFAAGS